MGRYAPRYLESWSSARTDKAATLGAGMRQLTRLQRDQKSRFSLTLARFPIRSRR